MNDPVHTARRSIRSTTIILAAVAYLPLLWSSTGKVVADTKSYLYLDPSRLLARAPFMWDENIGLGTVTHQNLGYVFPMGPYYWLMEAIGVPDWIAQRLWLGTLIFAAGTGVAYLCRTFGWRHDGAVAVAGLSYMLSPYLFDYASRISVILMPWAGLGWMIAFTVRALRDSGWRWPARFALVVALVGGVNATSLLLAGIAPVMFVLHAVITREASFGRAAATTLRIGAVTVPVSLWWIAGLRVQGTYGVPILRYTETYEAVARTATSAEVLRGLGYWFFYGQDKVAPWVSAGRPYTQQTWLILCSFGLVGLGLLAFGLVRWKQRSYALALLVVGTVISVGGHPYESPSVYGTGFKAFVQSAAGLALRSTPRAVPLIAVALALALGAGVSALSSRLAALGPMAKLPPLAAGALVLANVPTFLLGQIYTPSLLRDGDVPVYWQEAAAALDAGTGEGRVFETPGSDFADYRWGGTIDPITPGLIDKPYVARELIPYGGPGTSDLLNAFERRLSDNVFEPETVGTFARLISADTIAVRADLQYERYRTARPRLVAAALETVRAAGQLGEPQAFGPGIPNDSIDRLPLLDEYALTAPPQLPDPSPVTLYPVPGVGSLLQTRPLSDTVVVDGDGEALMDLAAAGLLTGDETVVYGADLAGRTEMLDQMVESGSPLLVTDGNRRQARRWGSVRENLGVTEQAGETPLVTDINDNRLDLFPDATDDAYTVTELTGARRVQATGYGNPITYTPEDRASQAFDGDPLTAWRVGAFAEVTGEKVEIELEQPVTTDRVVLLQPVNGVRNRWLTEVRISFDGGNPFAVELGDESRVEPGQTVTFPSRTFTTMTVEIVQTNIGKQPGYRGVAAVGFAEIGIEGVRVSEMVRLPRTLLGRAQTSAVDLVLSRQRASQLEANRTEPELSIRRTFDLATTRSFTLSGQARLSGVASDISIEQGLGGEAAVTATDRLRGDPRLRAGAVLDSDPATAWTTPIDKPLQSISLTVPGPVTVASFEIDIVNDGRHSLPSLTLQADGGAPAALIPVETVQLPSSPVAERSLSTLRFTLDSPVTVNRYLTLTVAEIEIVETIDYFSELPVALPVAIAEVRVPGIDAKSLPTTLPAACRDDLVMIDGTPLPVRLVGDTQAFAQRQPVAVEACVSSIELSPGRHTVTTATGRDLGIDIDRVVLSSEATTSTARVDAPSPTLTVLDQGRVSSESTILPTTSQPFWLMLGQTQNAGWQLDLDDGEIIGTALVNGYANGWLIQPSAATSPIRASLDWTPQRSVWIALLLSAIGLFAVLILGRPSRTPDTGLAEDQPTLATTSEPAGSWLPVLGAAVAAMVFAAPAREAPIVAFLVALVGVASRQRMFRRLTPWIAPAAIGAVAMFVIAKSARYDLPTDLEWPSSFGIAHHLGWFAVCATVAVQPGIFRHNGRGKWRRPLNT